MPATRGPAPDFPIVLPEDHAIVASSPMLGWKDVPHPAGGQPPLKQLHIFQAVRCFLGRCSLSTQPAEAAAWTGVSFLEFDLNVAAWNRIIDEYDVSGLAQALQNAGATTLEAFDQTTRSLNLVDATNLILEMNDVERRELFDTPAGGAPRGRGRGHAAARVAVVPGPPVLKFLEVCKIPWLEDTDGAVANLWPLAYLAGMLGPVSTRAVRLQAVSTVQLNSALIVQQLACSSIWLCCRCGACHESSRLC